MARSEEFRQQLTTAVHRISAYEADKPISVVQDELGYALNKSGGSALEWWRQGNLPKTADVEKLAREIIRRSDLGPDWLCRFLESANYPYPEGLCRELFPAGEPVATRPAPPVALPNPTYRVLVGREELLKEILEALQDAHGRWVVAIDGLGGMGKTALAREAVAHCEKDHLFERVVWLSAAGQERLHSGQAGSAFNLESVLDGIARHLAVPGFTALDVSEKRTRLQTILRQQRVLAVLDNLESASEPQAELLNQLYPALNPSKILCTSRRRFAGDTYAVHLGGLTPEAALHFIHQEGEEGRVRRVVAASPAALAPLVEATGGAPLALKLVVGQLRHLPLGRVLQSLYRAGTHYPQPGEDADLARLIFWPSWRLLSRNAQSLLVALALFVPGEGGGLAALQAVSGLSNGDLTEAIHALWRLSLLEVAETGVGEQSSSDAPTATLDDLRYFLHILIQNLVVWEVCRLDHALSPGVTFVEEQSRATRPRSRKIANSDLTFLRQCVERGLNYLLVQIENYAALPPPENERRFAMHLLKYAFLFPEVWPRTSRLLIQLAPKMEQAGHRRDWLPLLKQGAEQSQLLADERTSAELQLNLGILHQLLGDYAVAAQRLSASIHQFGQIDARLDQARAMNRLAYIERLRGRYGEATCLAENATHLLSPLDPEYGSSHTVLGAVAFDLGDWAGAAEHFRQSLILWEETGNQLMIARRLRDLGPALRAQQRYTEAIDCYARAIALFGEFQEPAQQAVTRMNLGVVYTELREVEQAVALYRLAEPIFQQMGDERQLAMLYYNLGLAYDAGQQIEQAQAAFLTSIAHGLNSGDVAFLIDTVEKLIAIYITLPQHTEVLFALQQGRGLLKEIGEQHTSHPHWQKLAQHLETIRERVKL